MNGWALEPGRMAFGGETCLILLGKAAGEMILFDCSHAYRFYKGKATIFLPSILVCASPCHDISRICHPPSNPSWRHLLPFGKKTNFRKKRRTQKGKNPTPEDVA